MRFTLIELMIVVAIVAILAGIAVPAMQEMSLRAKQAEMPPNVHAIKDAYLIHREETGKEPVQATTVPAACTGYSLVPWESGTAFEDLPWEPDGMVRGCYGFGPEGPLATQNLDRDGIWNNYCCMLDGTQGSCNQYVFDGHCGFTGEPNTYY